MGTMIYLWRIASDCPDNCIAVHDKQFVDPPLFRKSEPFEGAQPVRFTFNGKRSAVGEQDYLPNSAMLPLVSKAAALRLAEAVGDIIQIVQAVVVCDDGEFEATLINPLRAVAAVDWNSTSALFIPGTRQVMKFRKLELLPGAMGDLELARLDEFRSFILVSERVKKLFSGSDLCEFARPSEVRP